MRQSDASDYKRYEICSLNKKKDLTVRVEKRSYKLEPNKFIYVIKNLFIATDFCSYLSSILLKK